MRKHIPLLALEFLFFLGMWLSKTAWPLWSAESGDMRVFGMTYSSMAIAGAFSASLSTWIGRIGLRRTFVFGILLYAMGISLRWFNQSMSLGILSGALAGFGASAVILVFRVNARIIQSQGSMPEFIAARASIATFCSGLAGACIGGLFLLMTHLQVTIEMTYFVAIFSAVLPLLGALIMSSTIDKSSHSNGEKLVFNKGGWFGSRDLWSQPSLRLLLLLSLIGGIYTSLCQPFFPMYFKDIGFNPSLIAFMTTIATVASLLSQPISVFVSKRISKYSIFFAGEIVYILAVSLILMTTHYYLACILVIVRTIGRTFSSMGEQLIELKVVATELAPQFYAVAQTLFLIGDALGGAIGGFAVKDLGAQTTIAISLAFVVLHVGIMVGVVGRAQVTSPNKPNTHYA